MTTTGRTPDNTPRWQSLPPSTPEARRLLASWRKSEFGHRIAEAWAASETELNAREDECLRMFGITVEYIMDERITISYSNPDSLPLY